MRNKENDWTVACCRNFCSRHTSAGQHPHKSLTTTAMFYKKQTASALSDGMKLLQGVMDKN